MSEPTRQENLLDLILCNEPKLISGMYVDECFGTSDHNAIRFNTFNRIVISETNACAWDFLLKFDF